VIDPDFRTAVLGPGAVEPGCLEEWIECLRRFRFVSVRGVESHRVLAEHGFKDAIVVGDPALYSARDAIAPKSRQKRIGINISNYSYFWGGTQTQTVQTLSDLVKWLVRNGWTVTLIPSMSEDCSLAVDLAHSIGSDRIQIARCYSEPDRLLERMAEQDLFVGVKLHTVIAACCVYTPAIMIGYQPKCLDFMRTMGLESFHVRSDRLDLDQLIALIRTTYDNPECTQRDQFTACQKFRKRLLDFRDQIMGHLSEQSGTV